MDRFPPIPPEALSDEQRALIATITAGPRGAVKGPFVPLLHNPALAMRVQALGEHLRYSTSFPATLLELAILSVAAHWRCGYEWYAHAKLARKAGLAPDIIEALARHRVPPQMSIAEELVYRFCGETLKDGSPGDRTYAQAEASLGTPAVLDLLAICGYYSLLAFVLNTARPAIPDDGGVVLDVGPTAP